MKRKILTIMLVLIPCLCFADSESTIGGRTAKSHIIQDEGVSLRPRAYLNVSGDTVQAYEDNGKTILYSDAINEATADTIYLRLDTANDPLTGALETSNGSILSSASGVLTLGGTGATFNEDLTFDFESLEDTVTIASSTGLYKVVWDTIHDIKDDRYYAFGTGYDAGFRWDTTGNDNFKIATTVGTADASGYISVVELSDWDDPDRAPAGTSANPVLRVYSSDATQANDYIEMYHDQTDANIDVGSGDLKIVPSSVGNVTMFEDTDVDNAAEGKSLYVHRKAAEGDRYWRTRIDQYKVGYVEFGASGNAVIQTTSGDLFFNNNGNGDVKFFDGAGANENRVIQHNGYITADTAQKYIQYQVNDTTDNYELTREDTNIGAFDIQMPLITDGITSSAAISSATLTVTTSADNTDVSGVNTMWVTTTGGAVVLGGLTGGVDGQVLYVVRKDTTNALTLENAEGAGDQDFIMHQAADEIIDAGGVVLVCDGSDWYDVSHAKHVT